MTTTTFVDGQTPIVAAWLNDVNAVTYGTPGAIVASSITNTPAGNIAATNVQAAINELDTEKQPIDAQLTTLAGITAQQATDLSSISTFMGTVLNDPDAITARTTLGVVTASDTVAGIVELATSAETATGTDTTRVVTPAGLAASKIIAGTAVTLTTQTAVSFTGIPSWCKRVTLMFSGVSTSGTSAIRIKLGTASGIESTGYLLTAASIYTPNGVSANNPTDGFGTYDSSAPSSWNGSITFMNLSGNIWVSSGGLSRSDTGVIQPIFGSKTLGGILTQLQLTTVGGTDTLDAGSVNIIYE